MLMQRWQQSAGGTHSPAEKYPAQLILYINNINQSIAIGKSMFTDRVNQVFIKSCSTWTKHQHLHRKVPKVEFGIDQKVKQFCLGSGKYIIYTTSTIASLASQ